MRGKTAAVSSSSDGVQWGTTGFVAFPRSNVVLIADPRALQVVQHLHGHRYPITQVRWEELAEPLTQRMPRLLTGDDRGVVYVWNVEEHESKMFPAPFLKGSKGYSVLDLAWLPNKVHDEPPQFLVLYANHMLVGFNTAGRQLWTHDYSSYAPLQFALNPYNSSQAVMALPDSCVLIVDDISASSPPRAKPTDLHVQPRGDTGGLRHLSFNRHEEHQVVLAFAHQLVVLDLLVHRPVATVHLDRSSSAFRSVASCPHSPVLYCLHDNHSISIRSRLDQASMTYSFTGQSEALRLKTDTLLGIAVNPLNERQLCTATDAGALLLFNRGTDVDEPEPLLSAVPDITPIKALQPLFLSAQIPANSHPTCTAAAYADASGVAPFLAVGTKMGAVQLLETQPVHMSRQFTVCNNAIASVAWLGHHTLVALSSTDSATKHYHNILSLIHLPRGRVVRILDKHQKHKGRRVVPSSRGQYFLVTFETKPPELWSAKSGALITTLSTKLPPVADVSWSVSVSRLRQLQSPDDASSSHSQESRKDSDEQSFSNDATNDSSSSGVSSDGGGVYKEQFTYLGQDGTLCFFVVDHGHVECTRRITLDGTVAAFTAVVWKANVVVLTDASGGVYFWNSKDRRHNTVQTSLKNIRRVAFAPSPTGLRCLVIGDEGCAVIHPDLSVVERVRDRSHLHKIEDAAWLSDDRLLVSMDNGMIQTFTASLKPHTSPVSTVPISRSAASAARFGHKVLVRALLSAMHQPTKDEYTLPADASDHLARDDVYAKTRALLALLPPSTHRQLTAAPSIAHRCLAACHAFGDAWAASFWRLVLCTPPSHNAVGSSQEQQGGGLDLLSLEEGNATLQQSSGVTTADAAGSHNHGDEADGDGKDETKEQQHQQEQQDNEGEDDEEEDVHDSADTARQLPVEFGSLRSTSALRTRNRRSLHLYHDLHLQQPFGDGMRRLVVDKHVCLQQSDRAIQMLLQTDASKPNYYADALRACLIAATTNPATAVHTIKIAAMNLIAADRITEGVDLLVTIGHIRDACKYLQAYGRWAEAVDLAKTRLSTQAAHAVVEEYATHLCSHRQFGEAALHFVTTNNTDRAVECLRSMQQPHMAALFLLHRKHELDKTAAAADVSASSSSAPHDQQQQHHQHHQHHQQQQVSAPLATCDRLAAGPPPKSAVFLDYARLLNRFSLDQEAKWVCRHFAKLPISHLEDA